MLDAATLTSLLALQILQLISHMAPVAQKLTQLLLSHCCLEKHPLPSPSNPPWAGRDLFTPTARGEQLMAAVIAMAQPIQQTPADQSLLRALIHRFGLVASAQEAIAKVTLQLHCAANGPYMNLPCTCLIPHGFALKPVCVACCCAENPLRSQSGST